MSAPAIRAERVSKAYELYDSPRQRLLHALWPARAAGVRRVQALREVSFEVARGESVAIIGRNGGGKSTLLQLIAGTSTPSSGSVQVNGRVSALLELGSGFNPEYTGRDNAILNGMLLGMAREQVVARMDEIAAFAEIGDALERPVKTYSSGMLMRLAFAVQVVSEPEILIVDEALSVGDFFFQQKCYEYIRRLRSRGVTLLFVSHDMGTVRDLCSRALYLREGELRFAGETHTAIRMYLSERPARAGEADSAAPAAAASSEMQALLADSLWRAPPAPQAPGRLVALALYDAEGRPATAFRMGATMTAKIAFVPADGRATHVTFLVQNKFNQAVTSSGSSQIGLAAPAVAPGQPVIFEMRMQMRLETGAYSVVVSLGHLTAPNQGEQLDTSPPGGPITIHWDYDAEHAPFLGMFGLPVEGEFRAVAA